MSNGFVDVRPLETSSGEVARENLSNTFPPIADEGKFNSLQVGVGNYVLHVSDQGLWLGAEKFEDAPFSVTMSGVATVGGGGSIEGALYVGDAANDINTHTTTINGGKITTGTITADQIGVGAIVASKIASGAIISEKIAAGEIKAVNIAAGVIAANHIAVGAITGTLLADGSVSEVKIANAAISGGKIQNATITGGNIAGTTITGGNIAGSTISADKLSVSTLSAITANLGTITAGTLGAVTINSSTINAGTISGSVYITLPYSGGSGVSATGYLRFGSSNNKIWVDGNQYMGIRANGGYIYFYAGSTEKFVITPSGNQDVFRYGISTTGGRSYFSGGLTVSDTGATIYGGLYTPNGISSTFIDTLTYLTFSETSVKYMTNGLYFAGGDLRVRLRGNQYRVNLTSV